MTLPNHPTGGFLYGDPQVHSLIPYLSHQQVFVRRGCVGEANRKAALIGVPEVKDAPKESSRAVGAFNGAQLILACWSVIFRGNSDFFLRGGFP